MGSPLRVLHVVVNMNRGGAETFIMNLYRNIDRTKVQFDFLTCKEGVFDEEILKLGGKVHRIPYISEVGHLKYTKELDHFFSANSQYRIIHSHLDKMSGLVIQSAKKAGIPVRISHSHNTSSEGGLAAKLYKWYIGKNILTKATHFCACSTEAANWLFKDKFQSVKIVKNGIEGNKFAFSSEIRDQVRKELGLNYEFVIGHVGRFFQQKNHSFLIEVFAKFNQINQDSVLILVGEGPLKGTVEKQVRDLNLEDKVQFLGVRSDIHRVLQALDVFVFPSWHEGLPVTLIEAQGAGLHCLISDRISREVDLGCNLVEFISLLNQDRWVQMIKEHYDRGFNRNSPSSAISKLGYEINDTAVQIKDFYLNISGGVN